MAKEIDPKYKLPIDFQIAHITFKKGVELETVRQAVERWFKKARELSNALDKANKK